MKKFTKKSINQACKKYGLMRRKPIQHEERMCMDFIKLLTLDRSLRKYKKFVFHLPLGGKRDVRTGAKLKAMGTQAGMADYMVIKPMFQNNDIKTNELQTDVYILNSILFLEFKYDKGKQSESQKEFEKLSIECGHIYKVVYSIEEAISEIKKFWGDE